MSVLNNLSIENNPLLKYVNSNSVYGFDIPDVSMFGMLQFKAQNHPDALAYEYFGTKCTYNQFIKQIEKISSAYFDLGVRKGDIVTVLMPNTPESVASIYALNRLGAVVNIVHPLSAQEEIKRYLNSVNSKFLLTIDLCCRKISEIIDETKLEKVIVASAGESMPILLKTAYTLTNKNKNSYDKKNKRYISWQRFIKTSKSTVKAYTPTDNANKEVSIILHSGGTTGTPKDIMLSNKSFNALGIQAVMTLRDVGVGDRILGVLPIFHGFGLGVCFHVCFCFGACSIIIPSFDSKKFGSLLKKNKPTMLFGVPTLYEAMTKADGVENLDFSFLKYAISGGDTLPKPLEDKVNAFLSAHNSSVRICEGYGMTEGLAALSLSVNNAYKSGTIGKPLIGNEMCVVEPGTTKVLPPDEEGELCIWGPTLMLGYRGNEEETALALREHEDGRVWLHTGDMAVIDSDGFVHYKLRIKRMIISSGYNVYPTQVEKIIEELPEVDKCAVVSMPHPYKKEVPKAFIILAKGVEGNTFTLDKIRQHCKKNLSYHSVPYKYQFVKELPKTPYGKVDIMKLQSEEMTTKA